VDKLIVALDVDSFKEARRFVRLLKKEVRIYKVGSILFTAAGPDLVKMIRDEGGKVFLDLKYHDIPNTVAKACEAAAGLGLFMLDLHASGGREMLRAARAAVKKGGRSPLLVGVTVLTSREGEGISREVVRLAVECRKAGLDGVVCSPREIEAVRVRCGKNFVIVTPGIRPAGSSRQDDQRRVATPSQAIRRGADYLVIGRPILASPRPREVVQSILEEISSLT
jgi:orotidine-5'-phosphate decarboxylase